MKTRNRIEIMLDAIATATPIDNPRDRLEVFISAIASALANAGETNDIEPRDRIELLLDAIADAIGDAGLIVPEALSITENGTYTAPSGKAYTPVTVNVPLTTIESLSVTENGTYTAPSGKAYTPVTVNVPLPQNAVLLKSVADLPQDVVTISDGANAPLDELAITIKAVQTGTGEPSPENVRPISGFSAAQITIKDALENPTTTKTVEISFGTAGNVYGGTLNVSTGVLTVTHATILMKGLGWARVAGTDHTFGATISGKKSGLHNFICSTYAQRITDTGYGDLQSGYCVGRLSSPFGAIYVKNDDYTSGVDLDNTFTTDQIVYELETPETYQLTPTQIRTLVGNNIINADCGDITSCKYFATGV